jgi:hypothetical protein
LEVVEIVISKVSGNINVIKSKLQRRIRAAGVRTGFYRETHWQNPRGVIYSGYRGWFGYGKIRQVFGGGVLRGENALLDVLNYFKEGDEELIEDKIEILRRIISGEIKFEEVSLKDKVLPALRFLDGPDFGNLVVEAIKKLDPENAAKESSLTLEGDEAKINDLRVELQKAWRQVAELRKQLTEAQATIYATIERETNLLMRLIGERTNEQTPSSELITALRLDIKILSIEDPNLRRADGSIDKALPGFELIRMIGKGGMAEVWTARHQKYGYVTIKFPFYDMCLPGRTPEESKEIILRRFEMEVHCLRTIDHPNVMKIFEHKMMGTPFYAAEYVPGISLSEFINNQGSIDLRAALIIIYQAILGLEAAWSKKIIHRDLSPDNIMLTPQAGLVKIIDFGIARNITFTPSELSRIAAGKANYMPPETNLPEIVERGLDQRGDIFSLAIILYETLTGATPENFEGAANPLVAQSKWSENGKPTFSDEHLKQVPAPVHPLLKRMGKKDYTQRIASYAEIKAQIEQILNNR